MASCQLPGNFRTTVPGCCKLENQLNCFGGLRVGFHSPIGALAVAIGTNFALVFAPLHLGIFRALFLDGHIAAIILCDQILKRHVHAAGVALVAGGIIIIAYGDEPSVKQRKYSFHKVAGFQTVPSKAGEIFDNDAVHLVGPHQFQKFLYGRTFKICSAVAIVYELPQLRVYGLWHGEGVFV